MEDTDFDLLCVGLSPDEAKRMRKMLAEWNDGDENGFPVQLAMLTRAQWRAAALVPQAVNESRKLIAISRLTKSFFGVSGEMKTIMSPRLGCRTAGRLKSVKGIFAP